MYRKFYINELEKKISNNFKKKLSPSDSALASRYLLSWVFSFFYGNIKPSLSLNNLNENFMPLGVDKTKKILEFLKREGFVVCKVVDKEKTYCIHGNILNVINNHLQNFFTSEQFNTSEDLLKWKHFYKTYCFNSEICNEIFVYVRFLTKNKNHLHEPLLEFAQHYLPKILSAKIEDKEFLKKELFSLLKKMTQAL